MRRLVAAIAVRNNGSRLYGKPLQNLAGDTYILKQAVRALQSFSIVDEVVLCVADNRHNLVYPEVARQLGCAMTAGDENDVLGRLIKGAYDAAGTDVLRKTGEDPFFDYDALEPAWERHVAEGNDVTVVDHVPEGAAFEILTLETMERCHAEGTDEDREHIANYARFNQRLFKIGICEPSPGCRRPDLRLTVDQPEDLIVARAVYREFQDEAPRIPLARIVEFLDSRPDLTALVAPYAHDEPVWDGVPQREP